MAIYAFDDDKLLVETMSKEEINTALGQKVNTSTFNATVQNLNSSIASKANASHRHPFSQIDGLAFELSGTTLYISKN